MWTCWVFAPCLQLQLKRNLVKKNKENLTLLLCYTTSRVCLSTRTKSTCSLATHLHLNEFATDCLLSLRVCVCLCVCACVCVCTFTFHLFYWLHCQGFLVPVSLEPVQTFATRVSLPKRPFGLCPVEKTTVCLHWALVLFWEAWIGCGFDWFKKKRKKINTLWVLNFWTHWTA